MLSSSPITPRKQIRVRLRKIVSYEVQTEAGKSLGIFDQVNEMAGMISLVQRTPKHATSGTLVVDLPSGFTISSLLGEVMDGPGQLVEVIKASPQFGDDLTAVAPAAEGGAK